MKKTVTHKRVWGKLMKKMLLQAVFLMTCCLPALAR